MSCVFPHWVSTEYLWAHLILLLHKSPINKNCPFPAIYVRVGFDSGPWYSASLPSTLGPHLQWTVGCYVFSLQTRQPTVDQVKGRLVPHSLGTLGTSLSFIWPSVHDEPHAVYRRGQMNRKGCSKGVPVM